MGSKHGSDCLPAMSGVISGQQIFYNAVLLQLETFSVAIQPSQRLPARTTVCSTVSRILATR